MNTKYIIILLLGALIILGASIYYFSSGNEEALYTQIDSYQECVNAGYPVMRSLPKQCATPDGRTFTEEIDDSSDDLPWVAVPPVAPPISDLNGNGDDAIFCTMDAKVCPDGSYVGRVPPNCEFAPCPGN
jgi:hypothetical protein